jgi:hypothetical protein
VKAYCDTSFLVSLYTPDANSAAAAEQCPRSEAGLATAPKSD